MALIKKIHLRKPCSPIRMILVMTCQVRVRGHESWDKCLPPSWTTVPSLFGLQILSLIFCISGFWTAYYMAKIGHIFLWTVKGTYLKKGHSPDKSQVPVPNPGSSENYSRWIAVLKWLYHFHYLSQLVQNSGIPTKHNTLPFSYTHKLT